MGWYLINILAFVLAWYACISWVVYSTLFYSFFAITGHRQTIATWGSRLGWVGMHPKEKADSFSAFDICRLHDSRVGDLCSAVYWISQLKVIKARLSVYMVGIVAAFFLRNQLLVFLQSIVGYESFQQYEGAQAGILLFLLIAIGVFAFVFWEKIRISENPILDMSVNALMMACGFSPLLLINPSCMRVVQYYSVYLMFLLPELRYVFREDSRALFLRILAVIMVALLIKQMPSYSFFFM